LFPFHFGAGTILSRNIPNPYSIRKILKLKPTLFFAVPSLYSVFAGHADSLKKPFKSVRLFVTSGEKLQPELFKKWKSSYALPLLDSFGSTEMCHPFISNIPGKERPKTCGKIVEGFQVKFSKTGNILYRGPSLFPGYHGDEKLTRKRLKNGWFRSDDMGYLDKKGYMFFKGRDNLVVKSGGKWISFLDIENKLTRCPIVNEAAVTQKGDGLHCHVTLKGKKTSHNADKKIRKFCAKKMKIHELPAEVHVLKRIPKTRSGKINRNILNR
ncbi:MAG: AMP-binding protein, partial [Candidatus Omnitrophota bacterium]